MSKTNILFILGYLIKTIHVCLVISVIVGPYLVNNILLLSLLIMYNIIMISSWDVYGKCFLTDIEQYLDGTVDIYDDGTSRNFISSFITQYICDEKTMLRLFILIPVVNTMVSLWKINTIYDSAIAIKPLSIH